MNKKIKIVRGTDKEAAQKKHALEIGDVPAVVLENFETLTQPPFKPRLELIEADPHNPPDMNTSTDQNIDTDGEDSKRPSTEDIVRKSPDYQNAPSIEKEPIPHENEHVKQGRKVAEEDDSNKPDFLKKDDEGEEGSETDDSTVEARIREQQRTYATNYTLATKLFDIKLAAGIEQPINRYDFVQRTASEVSTEDIQRQITDGEAYLARINTHQPQNPQQPRVAGVTLPDGFGGTPPREESPFGDNVEAIIMGGI